MEKPPKMRTREGGEDDGAADNSIVDRFRQCAWLWIRQWCCTDRQGAWVVLDPAPVRVQPGVALSISHRRRAHERSTFRHDNPPTAIRSIRPRPIIHVSICFSFPIILPTFVLIP
ncbi:hypothetical protein L210DRAFT_323220 [Boletus edulis BED1]|uniref:Uncharacterized protein n=1 Tax=Boletus edulis BED1 TaxID=1328754 RepID=A0AAD4C166_BOLED|nr:hypothetical protein L210DRAFT_323220 [Boletus edulis BED1]